MKKLQLIILFFISTLTLSAQVLEPCKWSTDVSTKSPNVGDKIELIFNIAIDEGWHLYSSDFSSDCGPIVTEFIFNTNDTYKAIGDIKPIGAEKFYDDIFECDYTSFHHKGQFKQTIQILKKNAQITGSYTYQTCTDAGKCINFDDEFEFFVNAKASAAVVKEEIKESVKEVITEKTIEEEVVPEDATNIEVEEVRVEIVEEKNLSPFDKHLTSLKESKKSSEEEIITLVSLISSKEDFEATDNFIKNSKNAALLKLNADVKENIRAKAETINVDIPDWAESLWGIAILAFLGGLVALLTPCVFPMIPMTVTFFMHSGKTKAEGKKNALIYGFSIVAIYTIVGVLVSVTMGPEFANWLSTHWAPNVFFFVIFMVFALSFLGMFEITLPSSWVNKMDQNADKGGVAGAFFMAFTLVLVSFSCTGPIVGSILVEAAGGQILKPTVAMAAFGAAFAIPFTLFAIFPGWLSGLPKSGGWLNTVKVVLGFLEIALGLKFLSVADQTYHWGLLDREIYLAIWIATFALLGIYLIGKIRLPHDDLMEKLGVPRLMLAIVTFSFVLYLIPGMFGAPLKALSGYLPPQATHDFDLAAMVRENGGNNGNGHSSSSNKSTLCDEPKYADFLHLPHGLKGYFDLEQGLKCAKEQNKPIFIDFTGHGCVNCRDMEASVWVDPQVLKRLREDYIIVAMYCDDKTELPESSWYTSEYDQKVKKSIGKQNADYQINKFQSNSQPLYVLMGLEEESLNSPRSYNKDIKAFVDFLDKGKAEFDKKYKK